MGFSVSWNTEYQIVTCWILPQDKILALVSQNNAIELIETQRTFIKIKVKDVYSSQVYPVVPLGLYVRAAEDYSCPLREKPASYSPVL